MAQYTVTYSCGHSDTVQLYGPTKDRERKIAWFEKSGRCASCYRALKAAERVEQEKANEAENIASADANLVAGLPALTGSEKQIAWAETIRAKALAAPLNAPRTAKPATQDKADQLGITIEALTAILQGIQDAGAAARNRLETESSAKWWIENRNTVDSAVYDACGEANRVLVADITAREEARKEAEREAARAEERRRMAEYQASRILNGAKAATFRVSDRPGSVEVEGSTITVRSADGRTAAGYIDGGEWAINRIGLIYDLSSTHPEMERIAAEARAIWEGRQNERG